MELTKKQKEWLFCCDMENGVEAITHGQVKTAKSLERKGLIEIRVNDLNQNRCYLIKTP